MNPAAIIVEPFSPSPSTIEFVERKGQGHPDTICDQLSESLSQALCQHYLEQQGVILHHNVDKALLVAGRSQPRFGGGAITEPIEIYLTGRAAVVGDTREADIGQLAVQVAENWFRQHIPLLKPHTDVVITPKVRAGSAELVELFGRNQAVPLANDTSFGVGYAPLSPLEQLVLNLENLLHSEALKSALPYIGEDTKVMGVCQGNAITLTVAIAFVDRYVDSINDYSEKKAVLTELLANKASELAGRPVQVRINTADDLDSEFIYLTVSGTSAESGDDGQVGRGNRFNGLITPFRPMSLEAVSGKNPVNHVGKIYNIFAHELAARLCQQIEALRAVRCYLVSQIGSPITEPQLVDIQVDSSKPLDSKVTSEIKALVNADLRQLPELWQQLVGRG